MKSRIIFALVSALCLTQQANATPSFLTYGQLTQAKDLSGMTGLLENGVDTQNVLGGIGSGLAWAGGNTFLALPDRGPNATAWNSSVDDTTSYISRFQTVTLGLNQSYNGSTYSYNLTPTLTGTTLLYSTSALNYGATSTTADGKNYFNGRSDNFAAGTNSTNVNNARLDPEGIRVSNDGKSVYITDEYGPYVYQFDRATGARTNTYSLPAAFTINNLSSQGSAEISGNTSGRVANKGMEGLAITPNGNKLVGFEQSPLIQDGGDGGRANRIVTIDTATGTTHQYVYDNLFGGKTYNSSEILAVNDHEFLVLERDGKGLGGSSGSPVKKVFKIDLNGATDIGALNISGEANLLTYAVTKTEFLDLTATLSPVLGGSSFVPSKLEGMAFGQDIVEGSTTYHTLYVANDNDFLSTSGTNKFFVYKFTDADLGTNIGLTTSGLQLQNVASVPEPETYAMLVAGLSLMGFATRRRKNA